MRHVFALSFSLLTSFAYGQESKTVMTQPGKLLLSEDFSGTLPKEFKAGKGTWQIVDGALKGTEKKDDAHAATFRRPLDVKNAIIQYSFKLDSGAKTSLSLNSTKGHLSRVAITTAGIDVKKDSSDKNKTDKGAVLDKVKLDIKPGQWYTITLEQADREMLVSLDGKVVGYGKHEGLTTPISNIGFTVSGDSVHFKNLRVHEAMPNPDWPAAREKILAARTK